MTAPTKFQIMRQRRQHRPIVRAYERNPYLDDCLKSLYGWGTQRWGLRTTWGEMLCATCLKPRQTELMHLDPTSNAVCRCVASA
jgi:hypothetical protein